jgi:iron-sulfur cluster repair protein YtfE (RIC family)
MQFNIPEPLKREHAALHAELVKATKEPGKTGESARNVAMLLHPHFVKEEEFALPPLGMLAPWAEGRVTPDMGELLKMTDRMKAELPQMVKEHHEIVRALKLLADAAESEGKPQYARFAEKLILHAQTEEQVLYPAAILIGEYAKLKLKK